MENLSAEDQAEADRMAAIAQRAEMKAAARHAAAEAGKSSSNGNGEKVKFDKSTVKSNFMTKKEREAAALERLKRKRAEEKGDSGGGSGSSNYSSSTSNGGNSGRKSDFTKADWQDGKEIKERQKEVETIRGSYLGNKMNETLNPPKKMKPAEKEKRRFQADWDKTEDTSRMDMNPLYTNRVQVNALFGRGFKGGYDQLEQRDKNTFLEALSKKRMDDLREQEKVSDLSSNEKTRREKERVQMETAMKKRIDEENSVMRNKEMSHLQSHWSEKSLDQMNERDWRIFSEDFDIRIQDNLYRSGNASKSKVAAIKKLYPMRNWAEARLPYKLMQAINEANYTEPTPIQRAAIPIGLARRDIMGIAMTGSGKTASFVIPLLANLLTIPKTYIDRCVNEGPLALILAPVRELALQIEQDCIMLSHHTNFKTCALVGGQSIEEQSVKLRQGVQIVVGTPGRMVDLLQNNYLVLNQCNYVVLDEADRMLDMGFEKDILTIMDDMGSLLKSEEEDVAMMQADNAIQGDAIVRVTSMFSATMSPDVERIAKGYLRHPTIVKIGDEDTNKNDRIEQLILPMKENAKKTRLSEELRRLPRDKKSIVFVNAKKQADVVARDLENSGFHVGVLHGGKSQDVREDTLDRFRDSLVQILVATDVAGRGLDISDVTHVFNYDCPTKIENYTHRIGRTGRAGRTGTAITFMTDSDVDIRLPLKNYMQSTNQKVPDFLSRVREN